MSFKLLEIGRAARVAVAICVVTAALPSFGAKPYDAEVEYLDANATTGPTSFFDTGLLPADDVGARIRFSPKQAKNDTVLFGMRSSEGTRWYFGGPSSGGYYFGRMENTAATVRPNMVANSVYDVRYNHFNERALRVSGVDGATMTYGGASTSEFYLPVSTEWTYSGTLNPIHIFGHCKEGGAHTTGGNWWRIYAAQFTKAAAVVMDLIPVRKDGVGYMYDKVSGTLLSPQKLDDTAPDFVWGNDVAGESYIEGTVTLDADTDWTARGNLRLESGATIDLNGHSLWISGAFGDGTITDSSASPGTLKIYEPAGTVAPLTVTTSGITVLRTRTPYDAQVEYLQSTRISSGVSHIDLGFYPSDDMGARVRFMPMQNSNDSTLFGVKTKNTAKTWYVGGSTRFYLSWNANPAEGTRPTYTANSKYDVYLNYLNDRNRRIVGLDGAKLNGTEDEYERAISVDAATAGEVLNDGKVFDQTAYLFTFNNQGSPYNRYQPYRIYSAAFTKGDKVFMDLVPVRKDGVGYMYDKISKKLFGKRTTALPDFTYGGDTTTVLTGSTTLDGDLVCDASPAAGAVIDLKGHKLTAYAVYGLGTITDTSTGDPGELHIVVPEGRELLVSLALTGNLKVVKEGAGRLVLGRAGQTFTGGVVVAEGTAYAPRYMCPEGDSYWGPDGGTITVMSGATFDTKGNTNYATKQFVLAGGTLTNTGDWMTSFDDGICKIRLTADSFLDVSTTMHLWAQDGVTGPYMDLGGHKLTVTIASGMTLFANMINDTLTNGTVEVLGGGVFRSSSKSGLTAFGGSDTIDLRLIGCSLNMQRGFIVHDYYAGYTGTLNENSAKLQVHGTFTPAAVNAKGQECFYGCEMQNGSTIDLSAKSDTWSTTSTGFTGGSRTVSFADGATVTIDLHGRTLAKGEKIVAWNAAPSNLSTLTFALDAATAESGDTLVATESGIFYGADENTVAHAYWTGAVDNDVTKPGNWACTNFMGNAVTGEYGVPGISAAVHFSGEMAVQIPASQPIPYDSIVFSNVVLTNDCDWSGLAEWASHVNEGDTVNLGSVDLNGHSLSLATRATATDGHTYDFITLAVNDSSTGAPGELHISVPGETTYIECSGFALSGNLKLVKDGLGWLAMMRANQTFTGGVFIAAGTGYAPGNNRGNESSLLWGPDGGTITVVTNATFDVRGNANFYKKRFILNGGELASTGSTMALSSDKYGFGNVTLVADSLLTVGRSLTAAFSAPNGTEKIDLGGKTLTLQVGYAANLYIPVAIENGTLKYETGGYLYLDSGTTGGSPSVNVEAIGGAFYTEGELSVSNYVARYDRSYNHGAAPIKVYGTFTPAMVQADGTERFHGCEMQNGSSIDLSAKTNVWSSVALGYTGAGDTDGNRTMTFADGATVGVLLGTRNVKSQEKLIDWSSAVPENRAGLTFYGVTASGGRRKLNAKDDGVYWPQEGMIFIVR